MTIAVSQREAILIGVKEALQGMTDASIYSYPVRDDAQVTTDPTVNVLTAPATGLPLYVIEPQVTGSKQYFPAMQLLEVVMLNIMGRQDATSTEPDAKLKVWERMAADVERCLALDPSLAGSVFSMKLVGSPQPFVGVGSPIVAIVLQVEVRLHRTYGAP